jgi:predicted  nucleic acid-binding Zn-ribbon protein
VQKILQNLLDLQNVDIRLNDVRSRLAKFPKKLAESDARIAASKADLDASKAAQLATVKDRKKYELDVDSWKDKVRKYRDQT